METNYNCKNRDKEKQFKSYYVVWKPMAGYDARPKGGSLNRTMQYGNFSAVRTALTLAPV